MVANTVKNDTTRTNNSKGQMNEIKDRSKILVKPEPVHYDFVEVKVVNADFNYLIASIPDYTKYGFNLKLTENELAVCITEEEECINLDLLCQVFSTISKSLLRIKRKF